MVVTTGHKYSSNGINYNVSIIDSDGLMTNADLVRVKGHQLKHNDEDYNTFNPIVTASLSVEFFKTPALVALSEQLILSGEGRFYMELKTGNTTLFYGRVIIDETRIGDDNFSFIQFNAIDGLTLLKTVDFDVMHEQTEVAAKMSIWAIIRWCLLQVDRVSMKADTDVVFLTSTDFNVNSTEVLETADVLQQIGHWDYFTDISKNKAVKFMKCWDVLKEMLQRYGLRIDYYNDVYIVRQISKIYNWTWEYRVYNKNGQRNLNYFITAGEINMTNTNVVLKGAYTVLQGGLKRVVFRRNQKYIAAKDSNRRVLDFTTNLTALGEVDMAANSILYVRLHQGVGLPSTFHEARFTIGIIVEDDNVNNESLRASNNPIYMTRETTGVPYEKHSLVQTLSNSPVRARFENASSTPFAYAVDLSSLGVTTVKKISVRMTWQGFYDNSGQLITNSVSGLYLSFDLQQDAKDLKDYEDVSVSNTTNNYNEEIIEILASDSYSNSLAKAMLLKGVGNNNLYYINTQTHISYLDGKFTARGTIFEYDYADRAILRDLLTISTRPKKTLIGTYKSKPDRLTILRKVIYKDKEYIVKNYGLAFYNDAYNIVLQEIGEVPLSPQQDPPAGPIDPPGLLPTGDGTTNLNTLYPSNVYYKIFKNVNDNYVDVSDYVLPLLPSGGYGYTFTSIQKSLDIFVNGVKYSTSSNANIIGRSEYFYDTDLGRIVFFQPMRGSTIEVYIRNTIEVGLIF